MQDAAPSAQPEETPDAAMEDGDHEEEEEEVEEEEVEAQRVKIVCLAAAFAQREESYWPIDS